jgi:hypothetical protein
MFERLGNVIKSYLNDEDGRIFGSGEKRRSPSGDPDLNAAFEELNDFLDHDGRAGASEAERPPAPPEELRPDFAALGLPFGASAAECKSAYKKLLKIHHPDRHAGHAGNFKKATERTARINAAYDRIEKWLRETTPP